MQNMQNMQTRFQYAEHALPTLLVRRGGRRRGRSGGADRMWTPGRAPDTGPSVGLAGGRPSLA
jgi:hypothetical protein